jgi:hypothetical protein
VQKELRSAEPGLTRRGLFKSGLVVGLGAAGLTAASAAIAPRAALADSASGQFSANYLDGNLDGSGILFFQLNWNYCINCRCIYYAPDNHDGSCPMTGEYHGAGSSPSDYGIVTQSSVAPIDPPAYLQSPWRWCVNCNCLFWGNAEAESWCTHNAVGQTPHKGSESGVYYMPYGRESNGSPAWTNNNTFGTLQEGWRYCDNCRNLYWGGAWAESYCQYQIQSGGGHVGANNGNNGYGHAPGDTVYYLFFQ